MLPNIEQLLIILYDVSDNRFIDETVLEKELNASLVIYNDYETCKNYIESIPKRNIFFITSAPAASSILPHIHSLRQIDSVFLIGDDVTTAQILSNDYAKIIGIFNDFRPFIDALEVNRELVQQQALTFSFYNQHHKSTRDLTKESASFLWFQLFKDVILSGPDDDLHAKTHMVAFLRQRYHNNNKQLKLIDHFEETYDKVDAIRWYTGEPFLYRNLNKALRTEDIEQLHIFRFFISDLCKNILKEFQILKEYEPVVTLYRGTRMSIDDCQKLEKSEGQLISINGFLSTSLSKEVAQVFSDSLHDTKQPVLFQIECDLGKVQTIVLAAVAQFSVIPCEEEVLIDIGAVFQVLSVELEDAEKKVLLVKMRATDEGATLAKEYIRISQQELKQTSVSIMWGNLLMKMGQYDKALYYFKRLQNENIDVEQYVLQKHIGNVLLEKGELDEALQYYLDANRMIVKKTTQPSEWMSMSLLHDIAIVLRLKGRYDQALEYLNEVLKLIEEDSSGDNGTIQSHNVGACLSNIGNCYYNKGDYDQAMEYYIRSLKVKEAHYSTDHDNTAQDFNHIGIIYKLKGDYEHSLEYFLNALNVFQKTLPSEHHDISSTLMNIADAFDNLDKKEEALKYLMQALVIQSKAFPDGHLDMALCLNNIAAIYGTIGDIDKAFEHSTLSLELKRKFLPSDHQDIAIGLMNHGNLYKQLGNNGDAFICYMEALDSFEKIFPHGHPHTATLLINMGSIYQEKGNYDDALEVYNRAHTIQMRHFPSGHPSIGLTLMIIAKIHQLKDCLSIAIGYYMEAVNIMEKYYNDDDKNLTNAWLELANMLVREARFEEAIYYYKKVFRINEAEVSDAVAIINHELLTMASLLKSFSKLELAREYYEKVLLILKKFVLNDRDSIVISLISISEIYEEESNYDNALGYALQALEVQRTINSKGTPLIIKNLNNIGFLYTLKTEYESALVYYLESVELYKQLSPNKKHSALAMTLTNIGTCYTKLQQKDLAIQYYRDALDIYKQLLCSNHGKSGETDILQERMEEINAQIIDL